MGLEEDIQRLKDTETGQVEKTIRTIEDSVSERQKIAREQEELMTQYRELIRQKVSTAIDNIFLLKDYIPKPRWNSEEIPPKIPEGYSDLSLTLNSYQEYYLFRILFKRDDKIEGISLYHHDYSFFWDKISFGKKWRKYLSVINGKSSPEFSEKFAVRIIEELVNNSDVLSSLMYKLINAPEEIRTSNLKETEKKKRKKDEISSEIEKLNSVKVVSF